MSWLQDAIRKAGGIQKLVGLLSAGPDAEATHRALLALRILTDKEADRVTILKAGGIPLLVGLLAAGPDSEVTEYAAAALGNLAAGSQPLKDAIREVKTRLPKPLSNTLFSISSHILFSGGLSFLGPRGWFLVFSFRVGFS